MHSPQLTPSKASDAVRKVYQDSPLLSQRIKTAKPRPRTVRSPKLQLPPTRSSPHSPLAKSGIRKSPSSIRMKMNTPTSINVSSKAFQLLMGDPTVAINSPPISNAVYTPSYYKNQQLHQLQSPVNSTSSLIMSKKAHKLLIDGKSPPQQPIDLTNVLASQHLETKGSLHHIIRTPRKEIASSDKSVLENLSCNNNAVPFSYMQRTESTNSLKRTTVHTNSFGLKPLTRSRSFGSFTTSSSLRKASIELERTASPVKNSGKNKTLLQHLRVKALKKKKKKLRLSDSSRRALALNAVGTEHEFHIKGQDSKSMSASQVSREAALSRGNLLPLNKLDNTTDIPQLEITTVLAIDEYRSYFKEFCNLELSTENIDFWEECLKYEKWSNKKQRLIHAKNLYNAYICPAAPNSLNIDIYAINKIKKRLDASERNSDSVEDNLVDLLKEVKSSIEVCMSDTYHRFKQSQLYKNMINNSIESNKLQISVANSADNSGATPSFSSKIITFLSNTLSFNN
jgi:hypothetical protein